MTIEFKPNVRYRMPVAFGPVCFPSSSEWRF